MITICASYYSQNKPVIISVNSITQLVFITEMWFVFCEVGSQFLNIIYEEISDCEG